MHGQARVLIAWKVEVVLATQAEVLYRLVFCQSLHDGLHLAQVHLRVRQVELSQVKSICEELL